MFLVLAAVPLVSQIISLCKAGMSLHISATLELRIEADCSFCYIMLYTKAFYPLPLTVDFPQAWHISSPRRGSRTRGRIISFHLLCSAPDRAWHGLRFGLPSQASPLNSAIVCCLSPNRVAKSQSVPPDATKILHPGYRIHRIIDPRVVRNDLE